MLRGALAALGVYVCLLGAVVHRQVWQAGGVDWPWGLAAAIAVAAVVTLAANGLLPIGGAWVALGWGLGLLFLQWSPGGGYLVASDPLGLSFTVGSLGAIVLGVVLRPKVEQ